MTTFTKKIYIAVLVLIVILVIPLPQAKNDYGCEFGPCNQYNSFGKMIINEIKGVEKTEEYHEQNPDTSPLPDDGAPNTTKNITLGQEFTAQKGEAFTIENTRGEMFALMGFYYEPCPDSAACIWSGLDVYYKIISGGKTYEKDQPLEQVTGSPYIVTIKDSDYKTYAKIVLTEHSATSIGTKPIAQTRAQTELGGIGCFQPDNIPCGDPIPPHVVLNGHYDGRGSATTLWFEYWTSRPNQPLGVKQLTFKLQGQSGSADVSQKVYNLEQGGWYSFRLVAENSAGITYGNTVTFAIPIP